jgi:hypothetical protein
MDMYGDGRFEWRQVLWAPDYKLVLMTKAGRELRCSNTYAVYQCANTGQIQAKFPKAHWAKGRVVYLISNIPGISSGEYKIEDKEGQSYGFDDNMRLNRYVPVLDTPRKVSNWVEKQIKIQEALDGLTTDKIVANMKVL